MGQTSNKTVFCTIASANYLSRVQVLENSLKSHSPDYDLKILLCENPEVCEELARRTGRKFYSPADIGCTDWLHMAFYYNLIEYNTALKPYFIETLIKEGYASVFYFDPDIEIFSSLDEMTGLIPKNDIVLTPHVCKPLRDDLKYPAMEYLMQAGQFNLGFAGFSNSNESLELLRWWQSVCHEKCVFDVNRGYFVDQSWAGIFPSFVEKTYILRDPAYNVAYWNIFQRDLKFSDGRWMVDGKELKFFHFSGLSKDDLTKVSIYQNRVTAPMGSALHSLLTQYFEKIKAQGWAEFNDLAYSFSKYSNGEPITEADRKKFLLLSAEERKEFGDPFEKFSEVKEDQKNCDGFDMYIESLRTEGFLVANLKAIRALKRRYSEKMKITNPVSSTNVFSLYLEVLKKEGFIITNLKMLRSLSRAVKQKVGFKKITDCKYYMRAALSIKLKFSHFIRESAAMAASVLKPVLQRHTRIMGLLLRINERVLALPTDACGNDDFEKSTKDFSGEPGVNLIGYINAESGVGEGARANIRSFERAGVPFALNNLKCQSRQGDATYTNFTETNPYRVNLAHVNADMVPSLIQAKGLDYLRGKYNIGFWYWELSKFPEIWFDRFRFFNEIWVATGFCQESISAVAPVPVTKIPPSVVVENIKEMTRGDFGLKEGEFVFLFAFDIFSFLERKNPFALIRAFRDAFPAEKDVRLVLKCSNMERAPDARERLLKETEGLNVKFIDRYLDKDEINALLKLSDCYVSLHRSEGFGLPLAEAMYLGKPVIATGYSGNTDFMNANNSFPVKYRLVEIEKSMGPYKKGNIWADPDHAHAVELMRLVYNDKKLAAQIGKKASEDIKAHLSPEVIGKMISERFEKLRIWN